MWVDLWPYTMGSGGPSAYESTLHFDSTKVVPTEEESRGLGIVIRMLLRVI